MSCREGTAGKEKANPKIVANIDINKGPCLIPHQFIRRSISFGICLTVEMSQYQAGNIYGSQKSV